MAVIGIEAIEDTQGNELSIDNASLVTYPDGGIDLEIRTRSADDLQQDFEAITVTAAGGDQYLLAGIEQEREAPVTSMVTGAVKTVRLSAESVRKMPA
ncbi:hypothetical protein FIV42_22635 [Persicimonas caeni]|uniref:Uncharacterized protein n=1 Tax=Persicimonas caeni TaxID=2292766 RepID=A0A4Y6PYP3_PERCE|nr:hypothetical protein [Persicimonas caeni]QDG53438.1 hypothetical protein FIV42_22635 [Persicimonas caeni]QED34659.1 hypothetical protein FRD00_22630 [Persicimonas caeni]